MTKRKSKLQKAMEKAAAAALAPEPEPERQRKQESTEQRVVLPPEVQTLIWEHFILIDRLQSPLQASELARDAMAPFDYPEVFYSDDLWFRRLATSKKGSSKKKHAPALYAMLSVNRAWRRRALAVIMQRVRISPDEEPNSMEEFEEFVSHSASFKNGLAAVDHIQQITLMPHKLAEGWESFITRDNDHVTFRRANDGREIKPLSSLLKIHGQQVTSFAWHLAPYLAMPPSQPVMQTDVMISSARDIQHELVQRDKAQRAAQKERRKWALRRQNARYHREMGLARGRGSRDYDDYENYDSERNTYDEDCLDGYDDYEEIVKDYTCNPPSLDAFPQARRLRVIGYMGSYGCFRDVPGRDQIAFYLPNERDRFKTNGLAEFLLSAKAQKLESFETNWLPVFSVKELLPRAACTSLYYTVEPGATWNKDWTPYLDGPLERNVRRLRTALRDYVLTRNRQRDGAGSGIEADLTAEEVVAAVSIPRFEADETWASWLADHELMSKVADAFTHCTWALDRPMLPNPLHPLKSDCVREVWPLPPFTSSQSGLL